MVRRHCFFSGYVQGVGFRFTACEIARGFTLAGWVKNLPDGRVELVAEGEIAQVETFLQVLGQRMRHNIHHVEDHREPCTGEFSGFGVRR